MPHRRRWLGILCVVSGLLPTPSTAQEIRIGVRAGVPLTSFLKAGSETYPGLTIVNYHSQSHRYTFGAVAEWRKWAETGLEVGVFYHRLAYDGSTVFSSSATGAHGGSQFSVRGSSWDIPVVVKHGWGHTVRPFVAVGGAVRYVGPLRLRGEETRTSLTVVSVDPFVTSFTTTTTALDSSQPGDFQTRFYPGLTSITGVELRIRRVAVVPEFRYTRWLTNIMDPQRTLLRFPANQAEMFLGITF